MRVNVAQARDVRRGDMILIEGRDAPCIVASVQRFRGLTSITACDPASSAVDALGYEYPTNCVTFVMDDSDRAAVLV